MIYIGVRDPEKEVTVQDEKGLDSPAHICVLSVFGIRRRQRLGGRKLETD